MAGMGSKDEGVCRQCEVGEGNTVVVHDVEVVGVKEELGEEVAIGSLYVWGSQ